MDKTHVQQSSAKTNGNQSTHVAKARSKKKPSTAHEIPAHSRSNWLSTSNNLSPIQLLHLQRTLGNRAVGRLIQAKLTISHPDDPYEREADRVADTVMRMAEPEATAEEAPQVQAKPLAAQITPLVQRTPAQPMEEEEEKTVAPKPLVQRVPVAVREDDEQEKVAPKLEPGADMQEEEEGKAVQAKLEIGTDIQRQAKEDEGKKEEVLEFMPPMQRQMEEEEAVQTKPLSGVLLRIPGVSPIFASSSGGAVQRLCTESEGDKQREEGKPAEMVQRKSARYQLHEDHDEEEQRIQPKDVGMPTPQVTPSIAANIHALNHGGSPLPKATRAFFEPRFGMDFSGVRVHTGSYAAETAKSINARAFTVGNNIAFGGGRFAPGSHEGRRLMAHELTHVVQQSGASVVSAGQLATSPTPEPKHASDRIAAQSFVNRERSAGREPTDRSTAFESHASQEPAESAQRTEASSKTPLHRRVDRAPQKTKVELPVPLESVESIRVKLNARQTDLNQFLTASKQDVANIRTHFAFVNGVYQRSFDHHAMVIAQAKAQAESKQAWVDFAFGVGVGVSVGLMSEALIAEKLAETAFETVAEVGAELVEGGIARFVKPEVPKAALIPELAPEFKQIRALQILDDLNVEVIQMAVPGTFVFTDPIVQCERLSAELRLMQAGADSDHRRMSDAEITERFAKLTKFDLASSQAEAKLAEARASFNKLRLSFFARPAITDVQVEQDIWIPWIAAQDIETFFAPTLFNALIRKHLEDIGVSQRLGAAGLPNYDSLLGVQYWPHNPGTEQEHRVVQSYGTLKDRASAQAKLIPKFWNKVFLQ